MAFKQPPVNEKAFIVGDFILVHPSSTLRFDEVSFQWKNPDSLLKNPDSLLRNPETAAIYIAVDLYRCGSIFRSSDPGPQPNRSLPA